MDRREALATLLTAPLAGFTALEISNEDANRIDLEEGTVIAAVKHNGKTFASGIKLVPDDPRANIIQVKWLARALTATIRNL